MLKETVQVPIASSDPRYRNRRGNHIRISLLPVLTSLRLDELGDEVVAAAMASVPYCLSTRTASGPGTRMTFGKSPIKKTHVTTGS